MLAASAAAVGLAAGGALADGFGGGGGGGGGGPYAGRGASFGPRQMRIRCRDSRKSTSLRSCSFISSTSRRMRSISNTLPEADFDSLIGGLRRGCCLTSGGFGGGRLSAGRRAPRFSDSA